ncbi:MAG TPA: 5'/3'-nucleotidase SurE [Anaerohalosphaeraceae bacterium]|nr:5'/3'-nucleotidase SurE [Phycisphaerae bacterium]HOL32441.1 5'/3'-nucleotidase SurE [Anaerohalosphaeraceae bacterium]HRS72180.1 5'/3'-nucleotidase SurE [Anaerohalosphaeraceae bacterium]
MHILLTNDDGIFAPGLAAIYRRLTTLGEVTVAAPSDIQSGAGHSISLKEIRGEYIRIAGKFDGYSISGSPADCVKLAIHKLIDARKPVDLVVSGLNHGANVGINVFYSGTVAGAIEAAFYNLPAIAVSAAFDEPMDFEAASDAALSVIRQLMDLPRGCVANLNIPRLSAGTPKGILVVPQSTHGFDEGYEVRTDGAGQQVYKLTGGGHRDPKGSGWTDTIALAEGYITLTCLRKDLTDPDGNRLLGQKQLLYP